MPTYRSITLALHSQFDFETLPEYYPREKEQCTEQGSVCMPRQVVENVIPTCNVYVPVLPGSIFWIHYSIAPPVPEGHYFLFKLYINGAEIVSWSTGREEGWTGKTMFSLYEKVDEEGRKRVEKRVLCFASSGREDEGRQGGFDSLDEKRCLEIRICRAHGRKRVERKLDVYESTQHAKTGEDIRLVNAGRTSREQPKRFYQFALIDPVDQPFATFRYHYRTWGQLCDLGLLDNCREGVAEDNALSIIEPDDVDQNRNQGVMGNLTDTDNGAAKDEKQEVRAVLAIASPTRPERSTSSKQHLLVGQPEYENETENHSQEMSIRDSIPSPQVRETKEQTMTASFFMNAVKSGWKRCGSFKRQA